MQLLRMRSSRVAALESATGNSTLSLSAEDRELLDHLLRVPVSYMDSPLFHEPGAEQKVFRDAPEIPEPEIGWYQPAMEQIGDRGTSANKVLVLSKKQEKALFRKYNYARFRVRSAQDALGVSSESGVQREPAAREITELLRWADMAEQLRSQIAETNLALVLAMARRTRMKEVEFQDLVSEGNMALLRAIDKFNADLGNKFSTYACQAIIKAFSRLALKQSRHRDRFPVEFDPSFEKASVLDTRRFDFETDCATELGDIVRSNRCGLTDVERLVIESRFGIGAEPKSQTLTLGQVGQLIGVGKERVRQIQVRALAKIRHELEENFLAGQREAAAMAGSSN